MIQKQNRHVSMSVYLAVLAVDDTIILASGRKTTIEFVFIKFQKSVDFVEYYFLVIFTFELRKNSTVIILVCTFARFVKGRVQRHEQDVFSFPPPVSAKRLPTTQPVVTE